MALFKRFKNITMAKASKALEHFEDPVEQLDYVYGLLLDEKKNVDAAIRDSIAAKNLKKRELNDAQKKAASVHGRALDYRKKARALEEMLDELEGARKDKAVLQAEQLNSAATQLLEEEMRTKDRALTLQQSVTNAETDMRLLKDKQANLSAKIQQFADMRLDLKTDYAMAKANEKVNEALLGINDEIGDVDLTMQLMAEKIDMEVARAEASAELFTGNESDLEISDIDRELRTSDALSKLDDELNKR